MVLPRCFLQPCGHTCSLRAAPWVRQGPRRALPLPGLAQGPFSCPHAAQAATVPAPRPALCPLCLRLPSQALSVFPLELSLSPASGQSLSLSTSPVGPSLSLHVSASLACPSLL